ncbi:MAG: DUF452 family protein [Oscillospiraceae bacterium]
MQKYFLDKNSDELLIFFCGWGLDEIPFKGYIAECDVLFLFNYSNLNLDFDFSKYSKITLLAYSYGVFMSGLFKDKLPKIDCSIALNGTLKAIDDEFGIPEKIFALTLENMNLETALKFRRKLFNKEEDYQKFNKNLPNRLLEDSLAELDFIKKCAQEYKKIDFDFDKVIIASDDKIYPTKSQRAFWKNHKNIKELNSGHFPFYLFKGFQDIIEL